ncbi:MAG: hypothetical protein PUF46_05935, partial [Oscillospiraceae bacterium]|nr:hypothetical protein [Oscillospiraceae bacterium]
TPYDRAPLTQRDIDNFWNVVNNITLKENRDSAINDILLEEASAYFNGVKTAEEVSEIIQNRVALYLKEQN